MENLVLDLDFSTEIEDVDIRRLNTFLGVDLDVEVTRPTVHLKWQLQPDARKWGIKSMDIYVSSVKASIEWEVGEELSPSDKIKLAAAGGLEYWIGGMGGTIEIDSNNKLLGRKWDVQTDIKFSEDGSFYPDSIEIDFEKMIILIS